ncbi:MAG TPA: sugar ABC transporter substrate-binding protein [Anaerolineales bacterium]|nr:sugar ABC transporter substrate-binding protein [Anaerolineales bacterium]
MNKKLFVLLSILVLASLTLTACGGATPAAPATPEVIEKTVVQTQIVEVTAQPAPNPEAVIPNVEEGAEITLWTFWLSPTFDDYIKSTLARFNEAYPGVKVNWEDHQATFQDDLRNAFAAGNAPDVINLSISEGWVSDYATQGLLLPLDDAIPQDVKELYFPNLWDQQMVEGAHYQFPWYQGIIVDLVNTKILTDAGLTTEDFPKKIEELPAFCKTIKEKTGTLCDIRLTVNDLLAQMTYEGGVDVISEDGKSFTFDSPEAVAWLQMYVDMVKDGTVDKTVLVTDQDRVGLDLFTSGKAAFYNTGPNLIREVRANNPGLYGYLDVVPAPVGKSGVVGKGLMALSVKNDTKYPNAAIALAQFMSNPQSMLEFAKVVAVYPSTPASYDDPFFAAEPVAVEDSAKPYAKDSVSKLADILPTVPHKAEVNEIVLQAVQQALFNGVDPQEALSDAVAQANALLP